MSVQDDQLIAWHAAFAARGIVPTLFRWHAFLEVPLKIRWAAYCVVASATRSTLVFVPLGSQPYAVPLWLNSFTPPLSRLRTPEDVVADLLRIASGIT